MLMSAYRSGKLFEILGGIMVEEGTKWSPERAMETAQFFADLTAPEDKQAIHGIMVGAVLGFFANGGGFTATSPKSSSLSDQEPPAAPKPAPKRKAGGRKTSTAQSGKKSSAR